MSQEVPTIEISGPVTGTPVLLVGNRGRLCGVIRVHNLQDKRIVLRNAELREAESLSLATNFHSSRVPVSVSAAIPANQELLVQMCAIVDPRTAPGDFDCEILMAGATCPAQLHVTELVKLRFSPPQVVLSDVVGSKVVKTVFLSNNGNTLVTLRDKYEVELNREVWSGTLADGEDASLVNLLTSTLTGSRTVVHLQKAGVLGINVLTGSGEVPPGETRRLELELNSPKKLESGSRYIGRLVMYTTELEIVIV